MVRYKFQKEKSSLGLVYRPVAEVKLEVDGNVIEVAMYIDSGADVTMIPLRFGKALGFKQIPSDIIYEVRGISGGVPYILKSVNLILNRHKLNVKIAWALIEEVPLLLGRKDIFNRFKIIFNEKQGYIDFEEIN